ncbi:amidohydrolase [Sanyastnella coralliicola]|uniref:amidohydrolase n=1 Tax=Sanyastnella coralliicola TaxID=3069118 RepID=UPI0027BA3191|nr:amidohydrolase [Longitalea sp. SCSIO 12813]
MEDLHVSSVQCTLHWEDRKANLDHIEQLISNESSSDLIVLPEMFTTGFSMKPAPIAEDHHLDSMESLQRMRQWAKHLDAAIVGSISTKDQGKYYNRMYFVRPDGEVHWYDKYHLFTFANEDDEYSPGGSRVIVNWRGWNILLQVCYDLRFPSFARNTITDGQPDYDAAIYSANWPAVRSTPWKTLLRARAIENQCYVIGCNRVGSDGNNIEYTGDSCLLDSKGEDIAIGAPGEEMILRGSFSASELEAFRGKFPVLFDQ